MSFKPEFLCSGEWCGNGEAYATREEAEVSARSRFMAWTVPSDWRVVESDKPVSFKLEKTPEGWVRSLVG